MRDRGSAHVVAILLLIVIAVSASAVLYLWLTGAAGLAGSAARSSSSPLLRVEAVRVVRAGTRVLFYLWVRNVGTTEARVADAYVIVGGSPQRLSLAYSTRGSPVWGGNVYWVNREEGYVQLNRSGLIFYEDFRDGYDASQWATVSTLEPGEQGSINVDPTHGLVITISRTGTSGTEKYGLRLKNPLSISDGEFIAEYEIGKLSGINDNYLVEVYFSQFATTGNPHFLDQFVATYINGWYPPITYSTATIEKRDRYGDEWDYGFSDRETHGKWEARFNEAADKVYMHYCGDHRSGHVGHLKWAQRRHVHQPARVPGHRDVERGEWHLLGLRQAHQGLRLHPRERDGPRARLGWSL